MNITDSMLTAYADGELDEAGRKAVEEAVAADAGLAQALARHQALRHTLAAAFDPVIEEPIPQALLDAVTRAPEQSRTATRRMAGSRFWLPLAACLVLGLAVGLSLPRQSLIGPDMTAHGPLAKALEQQAAADGQAGAVVRIGLTFREKNGGRFCRTFQTRKVAGLACRENQAWRVNMAVPDEAPSTGDFRMAGGLPAAIMDQVQTVIDGQPLDAKGERATLAAHWNR